jgi:hypothetical protein
MDFVKSLGEAVVESASRKAFAALPDLSKAITELTVLKGVGPATASAVLAAYAPDVAPFMSDEVGFSFCFPFPFCIFASLCEVIAFLDTASFDGCLGDGSCLG